MGVRGEDEEEGEQHGSKRKSKRYLPLDHLSCTVNRILVQDLSARSSLKDE